MKMKRNKGFYILLDENTQDFKPSFFPSKKQAEQYRALIGADSYKAVKVHLESLED